MYKQLDNGIVLFIISKSFFDHFSSDAGKGCMPDYVLIEENIYDKVKQHTDLWAIIQSFCKKIELF